jgi:hypothetical protein
MTTVGRFFIPAVFVLGTMGIAGAAEVPNTLDTVAYEELSPPGDAVYRKPQRQCRQVCSWEWRCRGCPRYCRLITYC